MEYPNPVKEIWANATSILYTSSPQLFWHQGLVLWKMIFSVDQSVGEMALGGGVIQALYVYCVRYFYYYYISSTSGHQALDPRGWEPLPALQYKTFLPWHWRSPLIFFFQLW